LCSIRDVCTGGGRWKGDQSTTGGDPDMWVKIDDRMPEHPKLAKVGALGFALDVAAICYAARNYTDGFVPDGVVDGLLSFDGVGVYIDRFAGDDAAAKYIVPGLADAGLWERDDSRGGWWVHDYLDYNPSAAEVEAKREADRRRAAQGRASQKYRHEPERSPDGIRRESGANPSGVRSESGANPRVPSPSPLDISSSEFSLEVQAEAELKDDDDENQLRNDKVKVDSAIEWLTDRDVERKRASGGEAIRNLKNYRATCRAEREERSRAQLEDLARANPDRPAGWLAGQVLAAESETEPTPPPPLEYEPTGVGQGTPPPDDVREHLQSVRKRTKRLQDRNGGPT
jgi:hypothetical protein